MRNNQAEPGPYGSPLLRTLDLNQPVQPIALPGAIVVAGARNEWVSFSVQVAGLTTAPKSNRFLRLTAPTLTTSPITLPDSAFSAWQIVAMPVDLNRAGYVRHTGFTSDTPAQPRALLPLTIKNGLIDLAQLRTNPRDDVAQIWIDLHIPTLATPGDYTSRCDLVAGRSSLASVDLQLTVYDFVLSDERHLKLLSPVDWDRLTQLYPDRFENIRPTQINRAEPRYAKTVRTLDQLVALAEANRCEAFVPRLGPVVKWPAGQQPEVDWDDFVGVVSPWMKGDLFADKMPLSFWPVPRPDQLLQYDRASQLEYYFNAANRFDQNEWLPRAAIVIDSLHPGRSGAADSIELSALAAQILNVHPRVRVALPLEDDQLLLANANRASMIDPAKAGRLLCSAPSLIFAPPMQAWPDQTPRPRRWLRTDLPGLVPHAGAGSDERDVRLFAWLAWLRGADLIMCPSSLPTQTDPNQTADPSDLTWFYPGEWFGRDEPVPTLQLKWLRRAQQDYEYLWLAKSRGDVIGPLLTARAITKPVQIPISQSPDPVYSLMTGTVDPGAWATLKDLLARRILLRAPGQLLDLESAKALDVQLLHWLEPQDRQYQLSRTIQYVVDPKNAANEVGVRLGLDIYNASDDTPAANSLNWTTVPAPWIFKPQGLTLPSLGMFQINRVALDAKVRLDRLPASPGGTTPAALEWSFTNGYSRRTYAMQAVVPVAPVDRRSTSLKIDGSLDDWDAADAIQSGPLIKLLSRPALQRQTLERATNPTKLYTSWADENFYCAFKLQGVTAPAVFATQNFITYQNRRAWGEDLCELLIQPQYDDNSLGPVLHIVCKPTGLWIEKQLDRRTHADPWQPIEGLAVRYAGTVDGGIWRGELAIPWKALAEESSEGKGRPSFLRFNAVHHVGATGESASWAGPIDFGRDESFMGLLVLRDLDAPNITPKSRAGTFTESNR